MSTEFDKKPFVTRIFKKKNATQQIKHINTDIIGKLDNTIPRTSFGRHGESLCNNTEEK